MCVRGGRKVPRRETTFREVKTAWVWLLSCSLSGLARLAGVNRRGHYGKTEIDHCRRQDVQ